MSTPIQTCTHCGKSMRSAICFACDGRGYSREILVVKRECPVCEGIGRVWRCEDNLKHLMDDLIRPQKPSLRPPHPLLRGSLLYATTPWYPRHPENPWINNILTSLSSRNPR